MKIMNTENGSALAMAAVCRAFKPPLISNTAAMAPAATAQNMRCQTGEPVALPDVIMSMTSAPESADVTKKVTTSSVAIADVIVDHGKPSRDANSATGRLSPTSSINGTTPSDCCHSAVLPNTVIQRNVKSTGTSSTPLTNCRMVRPREMRAMNIPTKGDHAIHQLQ